MTKFKATTALFTTLWAVTLCALITSTSLAQKSAWEKETWPKGRKLVWAKPGKSGNLKKASNWLENGRPAKKSPDRETDIVLPAAKKEYIVKGSRVNQVRHVTIEKNAELRGGHRSEIEIWGNVDVRPGGWIHFISIRGDRDTYVNIHDAKLPGNGRVYRHCSKNLPKSKCCNSQLSHKFQICKIGTKSVDFISYAGVSDEVMLQHGKCIISGEFRFSGATNKGAFEVYDGGILEIQSGGRIASFCQTNAKNVYNINIYRNGVLQGGSPERPLTKDATVALGFANNKRPGTSGLYMALGSILRVYSKDPSKARLVFTSSTSIPGFNDGQGRNQHDPGKKASGSKGIAMQLAGDLQLNGVMFDYVMKGGIALYDKNAKQSWKNVFHGKNNAGSESSLYTQMKANPNAYYHARGGDQKSEYALTQSAVESMKKHLGKYDPFQLTLSPNNVQNKTIGKGNERISTPVAVIFNKPIDVKVSCKVPGAKIRYTTDGTDPGAKSPAYSGSIKLSKTTQITVKAYKQGVGYSPSVTTTYVFK